MRHLINERLCIFQNKVQSALDGNNSTEALKCHAVQKELENLLAEMEARNIICLSDYYTTKEAASEFGVCVSNMTKKSDELPSIKIGGEWHFLKTEIDAQKDKYRSRKKRGPKPKKAF